MNFKWLFPCRAAEKLLDENARLTAQVTAKLDDLVEDATTLFDRRHLPDAGLPAEAERRHVRMVRG